MKLRPRVLAALLLLTGLAAGAAEPDVYAPLLSPEYAVPVAKPAPKAAPEPAPPAAGPARRAQPPKKAPPQRRAVRQDIITMPPAAPIARAPSLSPAAPSAVPPVSAAPSGPVQINSCDMGGCTDTNGKRYNGGGGNAVLDPQGRLCTTTGNTVQCF
ncbi:hypothetical protein [Massilia glaciei]|uniref:Uncharacterized protein n=1 Tax=Massilia glaciei TaxID=1524097 RepID=A0A2U2I445_9BURK|nr:hypothetical protein [Massilia glaciei]PWF54538.1 hypothetical protein C7C56_006240 [Massilia glaciei]